MLVGLLWSGLAGQAAAGYITMQVKATVVLKGGQGELLLVATNKGDEPALNVSVRGLAAAQGAASRLVRELPPGKSVEIKLPFKTPQGKRGRFAALALVRFHDLNEYPFTTLAYAYFTLGKDRLLSLAVTADPVELAGKGRAEILLKNLSQTQHRLTATAYPPQELNASPVRQSLTLPPRGQAKLNLALANFSGLVGAVYALPVLLEEEAGGIHSARVVQLRVSLRMRPNLFLRFLPAWIALLAILLGLLIFLQFRARRRS